MNAVVPVGREVTPPRNIGVAKLLAQIQRNILDPLERSPWPTGEDLREFHELGLYFSRADPHVRRGPWTKAQALAAMAPPPQDVEACGKTLSDALDTPTDPAMSRQVVGMLLDAFPAGRPANLTAYADSILHDVTQLAFSPAAVIMGCQTIRRTSKFLPAVAEVIEACETARKDLRTRFDSHIRMARKVEHAREIAALPEPEPSAAERESLERRRAARQAAQSPDDDEIPF
jgi:hypothetical protein